MKTIHARSAALAAVLLSGSIGAANAAGTEAGTNVSNSIDLSYVTGGETVAIDNADTASFVVDNRIDLSLEGQDAGATVTVAAGANEQVLSFLLTNEGNSASGYDIVVGRSAGDLDLGYDANQTGLDDAYYTVLSDDAVFDSGDTVFEGRAGANDVDLAPDEQVYVLVIASISASTEDGLSEGIWARATAMDTGTDTPATATPPASRTLAAEDNVFADPDLDGAERAEETLVVTAPRLTYSKDVLVVDENLDGSMSASECNTASIDGAATAIVPQSCLEYTITLTNGAAATSPASSITITDPLAENTTYVGHSAGGFDDVSYDAGTGAKGTVTGTIATLPAGETASFTIRVLVD